MPETKTCPKCGAELPGNAPAGICPKCLMQAGLASEQDSGSSPEMKPTTLTSGFVPPEPDELAQHFPQLEILELLGKGGMGAVYKARQPGLDRLVAVKILPPEVGAVPDFAERFTREARALAKLSHQNIVSVFDFGQVDGQYYFVMEFVDGANLRHVIETGAIKPEEALAIVPQICEALQFAHDEGIVHRDIKPENILVDKQGRVKIADFGLAKLLGKAPGEFTLTGTHQVMGTLHYMAPEQMQGARSVDHRADIYSLGVVFYEMLTGKLPVGRFEPPSKKVQVDVRVDEVVLRTLEQEPERRYQQAGEVKTDVESISGGPRPAVASQPSASAVIKSVQNAAAGLLATGVAYWVTVPVAFVLVALDQLDRAAVEHGLWWFLFVAPALAGGLLVFASAKMRVLEHYPMVAVASVLPVVILVSNLAYFFSTGHFAMGPGDLIGPPLGLWALAVVTRRDARVAFGVGGADGQGFEAPLPAAKQVKGPAIGLIVTGIANWIGTPIALLIVWQVLGDQFSIPQEALGWIAVCVYLIAGLMIVAGLKMMQCNAYWLAVVASIAAIVVNPGNLIGLPLGLWSLVVLSNDGVRAAFRNAAHQQAAGRRYDNAPTRPLSNLAILLVVGVLLAVVGFTLLVLGLMLSTAGSNSWWWFTSGAFATIVSGVSWVVSTWSRYRRLVGAGDLTERPGWFWLDGLLSVYAALGVGIFLGVIAAWRLGRFGEFWPGLGLATIALVQAGSLLVWRSSKWRTIKSATASPTLLDRRLLILAVAIVASALMLLAGVAGVIIGTLTEPGTKMFWGLITGGGGCVIGGGGSLFALLKACR